MRKIITLLHFQLCVDIIGLPVYFVQNALVTEQKRSKYGMKNPKIKSMKLYSYLITQNE